MFTAYVVVAVLTAAANGYAATVDFTRPEWLLRNMAKARVPQSWLFSLGALKAAGALGVLAGIGTPLLGIAASAGLVLFFIGALITHFRARYWDIAPRSRSSCWPRGRWCCELRPPEQSTTPPRGVGTLTARPSFQNSRRASSRTVHGRRG